MLSAKIGRRLDPYISKMVGVIPNRYISPNLLSVLGLMINIMAAIAFIYGRWQAAGGLILVGGLFDMLDGAVARASGKVSKFGELLDSVIDRYSDLVLLLGLIVFYARIGEVSLVLLTCIATLGTFMVPYTRAKAERFIPCCTVGLMERAERIILLAIGSIFNFMGVVLWILAILTHLTALHRVYFTWKEVGK